MKCSEELTTDCVGNLKGHTSNDCIKGKGHGSGEWASIGVKSWMVNYFILAW